MTPRNASGISPEELSIQDAYQEGQRAGWVGTRASLNPYSDPRLEQYKAWERGRNAAEGARLSQALSRRAA